MVPNLLITKFQNPAFVLLASAHYRGKTSNSRETRTSLHRHYKPLWKKNKNIKEEIQHDPGRLEFQYEQSVCTCGSFHKSYTIQAEFPVGY